MKTPSRLIILLAGLVLCTVCGVLYAWSIFVVPLEQAFGWQRPETSLTFTFMITFFSLGMFAGGKLLRFGPARAVQIGGALLCVGLLWASRIDSVIGLYLSYGVVSGFGIGIVNLVPAAVCLRWYPERKGLVSGLLTMALALGTLLFGTVGAGWLIGKVGVSSTFMALAVLFLGIIVLGSLFLRMPEAAPGKEEGDGVGLRDMLHTPSYWMIWGWMLTIQIGGLMIIGHIVPYALECGLTAAQAGLGMGVYAIANGVGRLFFGYVHDRFGRAWGMGLDAVFMGCGLVLLAVQLRMPTILVPKLPHRHTSLLFFLVSVGACLFVMGISGIYTGFRLKLNLSDVYGIRAEAAAYDIPGLFAYVLSWMTVILSVLILYWLQKRRYVAVGVLVVVYLFYYSISAQKSVFLFLFLLLFCYLLYRKWMYHWCAGLLSLGVMGCWVLEAGAQFLTPMSLFVRRLMYVPVQLSEVYAQFFREHPLNLFRDGILGKLSYDPVYSIKIPKVIGEYMGTGSSANNGLVGDMYANLPVVLGVFLMPLILVILFRLLDAAARDIPQKIYIGLCVFFAMSFCNGSWSTVLLSGGFLMACIFLYLFPVQKEEHVKNEQS